MIGFYLVDAIPITFQMKEFSTACQFVVHLIISLLKLILQERERFLF